MPGRTLLRSDKMKVLVTGGAGFIGAALSRRLLAESNEVVVLDDLSTGKKNSVPAGARLIVGDVRDIESCREAVEGCEIVFHEAALPSVARSIEDPVTTHAVNATGTLNILKSAADAGCRRLIYASSSSVYGEPPEALRNEDQRPAPISPYAVSKLAGENYAAAFSASLGLSTVSLRYFNVFGPGQNAHSKYAAVFPRFTSALLRGDRPEIFGDGEQTRDFTFIDDIVSANLLAAAAGPDSDGEVFNVGWGRSKSVKEVLRTVGTSLGNETDPIFLPARAGDVRHSLAALDKSRVVLGYEPEANWEESVLATVQWFKTIGS